MTLLLLHLKNNQQKPSIMIRKAIIFFQLLLLSTLSFSQWNQITNYPGSATDGAPAFTIGNYAYVGGGIGSKTFYKFDPSNDSWTQLADIPSGNNRGWAFGFVINGKAYVCGGDKTGSFDVYKNVQEYDPATDTWTQKANLPIAMDGAFACSVNGKGYVIGGFNGSAAIANVYEYDPTADTWTTKTSYPGGQAIFPSGFVIDNKIYVGLGSASGMAGSKLFYQYDPSNNSWNQKATFPGSARQACIGFAIGHTGYIGGGEENYSSMFFDFYKYNPYTNSWTKENSLNIQSGTAAAWCSSFVIGTTAYYGLGASFAGGNLNYSKKFYKASIPLSFENIDKEQKLEIFPNPAHDKINIKLPTNFKPTGIIIINSLGKKCLDYSSYSNEINIGSLSKGVYIIEILSERQTLKSKLIIQ